MQQTTKKSRPTSVHIYWERSGFLRVTRKTRRTSSNVRRR